LQYDCRMILFSIKAFIALRVTQKQFYKAPNNFPFSESSWFIVLIINCSLSFVVLHSCRLRLYHSSWRDHTRDSRATRLRHICACDDIEHIFTDTSGRFASIKEHDNDLIIFIFVLLNVNDIVQCTVLKINLFFVENDFYKFTLKLT